MRWKTGVEVERDHEVWFECGDKKKIIDSEDVDIVELIESGVRDDDELLRRLSEQSGDDVISSGFRLAQFVEDYGEFIAEGTKARVFG